MTSDICKINISIDWHGKHLSTDIEQEWWSVLPAEDILLELENGIQSLEV